MFANDVFIRKRKQTVRLI